MIPTLKTKENRFIPPYTYTLIMLAIAGCTVLISQICNAEGKYQGEFVKDMVFVPKGEFVMGTDERHDDEGPEHSVFVEDYYIDIYEVTNIKYKKFFTETKRKKKPYHWKKGIIPKGKEKHPVIYVNWFDANDYCKWEGKRLPIEQEWEKAARGTDGRVYPWGDKFDPKKSNNPQKKSKGTEPVGSYENGKSPYGLYDMSGNVWEWVDSWYLPHPGNRKPKQEYGRNKKILKGGSWFDCLTYGCGISAPAYNRSFFIPKVRNHSFGFRCAWSEEAIKN